MTSPAYVLDIAAATATQVTFKTNGSWVTVGWGELDRARVRAIKSRTGFAWVGNPSNAVVEADLITLTNAMRQAKAVGA